MGRSDGANAGLDRRTWGRRPFANRPARELLNEISAAIARRKPEDVEDPSNPTLDEVIKHADLVGQVDEVATDRTLSELVGLGMTFEQAVYWTWYYDSRFGFQDIFYAAAAHDTGGKPSARREEARNIRRVLVNAADVHPDADPADIPPLVDGDDETADEGDP